MRLIIPSLLLGAVLGRVHHGTVSPLANPDPNPSSNDYTKRYRDQPYPQVRSSTLEHVDDLSPSDDTQFDQARCKGAKLFDSMSKMKQKMSKEFTLSPESVQSNYLTFSTFQDWGYRFLDYNEYYDFDVSLPIKPALEAIGVSVKKTSEGGHNQAVLWEHEEETEHDGKKYPPTHASYTFIFNPQEGVIVGWGAFSPAHMGPKQTPPVDVFPDFKLWSDIAYLQWADLHKETSGLYPCKLRYIFRTPCVNPITQDVIKRVMERTKKRLGKWPGETFYMETDEGKAILGTPNGSGVGYLLAQHANQLGDKIVEKVVVFQDEGKKQPRPPSLLFYIKDLPSKERTKNTS